jgi:hypothetical protein
MKAQSRPLLLSLALAATVIVTPGFGRDDGEGTTVRAKFSDPGKPGTLKLSIPWAEAHITGTDDNEIVVTSSLDEHGRQKEVDDEGFRRLDEDVTFELVEKDNVATISIAGDNPWVSQGAEFKIKVPRNTNLVLRTEAGGDIEVGGVEGDIDISSMNGEVTLTDIGSSAVVNTMNGEIKASFAKVPTKPVSLSSMNGEIDLRLPGDTKANLRMRTHNGSIRTNFPEGALQAKTEKKPTGADARPDSREYREYQREIARVDRERARVEREAARIAAEVEAAVAAETAEAAEAPTPAPSPRATPRVHVAPVAPIAPVAPMAPMAPMPPMPPMPNFGGKSIVGTLNGGGVDIKLTSMNGTITLRANK